MSCRVLKRDMELAMLDRVAELARKAGVRTLYGYYLPTAKNGMVSDHYEKMGFTPCSQKPEAAIWSLDITNYQARNSHIKTTELSNG
jgi:predicted enzyme involved in methoxymalonyl-ACP biosynthesis